MFDIWKSSKVLLQRGYGRSESALGLAPAVPWQETVSEILTLLNNPLTNESSRTDFLEFLAELASIRITDLETRESILQPNSLFTPLRPEYLVTALSQIQKLSLTLRLPLSTFEEIERTSTKSSPPSF